MLAPPVPAVATLPVCSDPGLSSSPKIDSCPDEQENTYTIREDHNQWRGGLCISRIMTLSNSCYCCENHGTCRNHTHCAKCNEASLISFSAVITTRRAICGPVAAVWTLHTTHFDPLPHRVPRASSLQVTSRDLTAIVPLRLLAKGRKRNTAGYVDWGAA